MKKHRKQKKEPWFDRFLAYRIGLPIGVWIIIISILLCVWGIVYVFQISGFTIGPSDTKETFIAEIVDKSSELHASEGGSYTIHYVKLKRDDKEFTCKMSSILTRLWLHLEIAKRYEISVNWTTTGCYIFEAIPLNESTLQGNN